MSMEVSNDNLISADNVVRLKNILKNICYSHREKPYCSLEKNEITLALTKYYSIIFSEKLDCAKKNMPRPQSERVYESISTESLERVNKLESKIKSLSASIETAKAEYRRKLANATKLPACNTSSQESLVKRLSEESEQQDLQQDNDLVTWLDQFSEDIENTHSELNNISSLLDDTDKKAASLLKVAASSCIGGSQTASQVSSTNAEASKEKLSTWGFCF